MSNIKIGLGQRIFITNAIDWMEGGNPNLKLCIKDEFTPDHWMDCGEASVDIELREEFVNSMMAKKRKEIKRLDDIAGKLEPKIRSSRAT